MNVFISYAHEDIAYVEQLIARLKQHGVEVWYDRLILVGADLYMAIDDAIAKSQATLVILSPESINAIGVHREVLKTQALQKMIIPILINDLEGKDIPSWIIEKRYADARNNKDPLDQILAGLEITKTGPTGWGNQPIKRAQPGCLSNLDSSLIIVPDGGLISKERVGINSKQVGNNLVGILTSFPDDVDRIRRVQFPVRLIPLDIVPENSLVISKSMREGLGLSSTSTDSWQMEYQGITLVQAQQISFEVPVEVPLEDAVEKLEASQDLAGRLIWAGERGEQDSIEAILLEISGRPYRISQMKPRPASGKTVLEIIPATDLSVFSSSAKSGVDIVILADCSGSMGTKDLTDSSDQVLGKGLSFLAKPAQRNSISRMDALHRALNKLLEMRLRISGRVSRIALVSFTSESAVRFPSRGGGMAEVNGASAPDLIRDFREAIGLLRAEEAGTVIGQALHYAAELLHKHGHPGNERLIVLISDGADWKPKEDKTTGEMHGGLEDPVSLMIHLHENLGIRLHAIGISNRAIFDPWFRENYPGKTAHESIIPNHELLASLVEVGGNDPSRTGDTSVLEEYFSGLGKGLTRKVICPKFDPPPGLQTTEREIISASNNRMHKERILSLFRAEKDQLIQTIYNNYFGVNEHAKAAIGEVLLDPTIAIEAISLHLGSEVVDTKTFGEFAEDLHNLVYKTPKSNPDDITFPYTSKLYSSQAAKDIRMISRQIEQSAREIKQQGNMINIGQLGTNVLGKAAIENDDLESLNKLQLYFLSEAAQVLQQIQQLLLDKIKEEEQRLTAEVKDGQVKTAEADQPAFRFIE